MPGALDGVDVLSFAQLGQGPIATMMLGDMGADVVKVEPPGGEWQRRYAHAEAFLGGESATFMSMNRNKRSVELDLKDEDDREAAYALAERADVVVENFRPGVMEGLGFDYETLREDNPGLIYCSWSGYGESGPYVDRPGQDLIIQGLSGLMSVTGRRDDPPTPAGTFVIDFYSAAWLAFSVVTALYGRAMTGEGQRIEGDLLSMAMHLLTTEVAVAANTDETPERSAEGISHVYMQAPYGVYETADGYLVLSASPLDEVAAALSLPDLASITSQREAYERREEIKRRIEATLVEEPTDHWLDLLDEHDVWCGPVQGITEAIDDPQVTHNEMVRTIDHPEAGAFRTTGIPVRMSGTPGTIRRPPPLLGEHTGEVLADLAGRERRDGPDAGE